MIYLRNRYYDPETGRFISEDPITDGTNWYVYCGNNPVMFVDPWGLIRGPGYNAKGEWSENSDADDFGEDSAKYQLLIALGNAWDSADNTMVKEYIHDLANEIREFDDKAINTVYYLNNTDGAQWKNIDFGHAGIMLRNGTHSLLYSYYPQSQEYLFDSPSELRIAIFDDDRSNDFLNDIPCAVVATSGIVRLESYDRYIAFDISNYNGQKIMLSGANIANSAPNYNLISHNCDDVALELLGSGGINLSHGTVCIPNITYNYNHKN